MQHSPYGWWLPLNASTNNHGIDSLINILHGFMAILFVGWGIYLAYCLFRFRERSDGKVSPAPARKFRVPVYVEVAVVVVEIVLLAFVSSPLWFKYRAGFPPEKDALVVRVVAEQFAWNFHYPGADGIFGRVELKKIDGNNPVGLDAADPAGLDDIVATNELHIPVDQPVIAHLSSKDVIHDFFLPVLRVKQDVIPGMATPIWFQANVVGQFEVACAQLCGLGHYRMKGQLFIDTREDFKAWLAAQTPLLKLNAGYFRNQNKFAAGRNR